MRAGSASTSIEPVRQVSLPPVRPARGWYWLALVIAALGFLVAFVLLAMGSFAYLGAIDDLDRLGLPGRAEIATTGTARVYHEPEGGEVAGLGELELHVEGDGGEEMAVAGIAAAGERYDVQGRFGVLVAEIELPEPGPNSLVAEGDAPGRLAIGESPGRNLQSYGLGALAAVAVGVTVGTGIALRTRRRRATSLAARLDASRRLGGDTA